MVGFGEDGKGVYLFYFAVVMLHCIKECFFRADI